MILECSNSTSKLECSHWLNDWHTTFPNNRDLGGIQRLDENTHRLINIFRRSDILTRLYRMSFQTESTHYLVLLQKHTQTLYIYIYIYKYTSRRSFRFSKFNLSSDVYIYSNGVRSLEVYRNAKLRFGSSSQIVSRIQK